MNGESNTEKSIFLEAIERIPPEQWPAFLDSACADDVNLRLKVERLLAAQAHMGSFHEAPRSGNDATLQEPIHETPGTVIGPYKLLEQIGEGGFGVVFMAEQTKPVRRKVALKVLKPGMDTRQVVARFEAERQALAIMDHPHIAKIFDGGVTPTGRPYFVMELVKGMPITEFCDQNHYTPRQRLELFVDVCQAVQHAHQKGIIHRDLKPSNVLVTVHDTTPVVKVIDFGIAKALGQELTDKTLFTGFAQLIGTPLYMSPEQAGLSSIDVDTRSDVYSLGVLLYELLTGTTPFDKETLTKAGYDEMRRIIREDEPVCPSVRINTLTAQKMSTVSNCRNTEARKLSLSLRGELDWMVMKGLAKDRTRRYESASAMAADVQRFLNDEPVEACPPSAVYRLRKYAARNRGVLVTGAIVALALVTGTAISVWQAIAATEARDLAGQRLVLANNRLARETEARLEADQQRKAAANNLHRAIDAVDQMLTRVGDEKLRNIPHLEPVQSAILDDALKFYQALLRENQQDPVVRHRTAMGFHRMAWALADLPDPIETQREHILRAEAHRLLSELHEQYPDTAIYAIHLAVVELHLGWFKLNSTPELHYQRAIELLEPLAADPPQGLSLDALLASNGRNRLAVVPPDLNQHDPRECVCKVLYCYLANMYRCLGLSYALQEATRDEGIALMHKAIHTAERAPGWNQSVLGWCYDELSIPYVQMGQFDKALASIDKASQCWNNILKQEPNAIEFRAWQITSLNRRADVLLNAGRPQDAVVVLRDSMIAATQFQDDFPTLLTTQKWRNETRQRLILALQKLGRSDELEDLDQAEQVDAVQATNYPFATYRDEYYSALLKLVPPDVQAYQKVCARMIDRHRNSNDPKVLTFVAWTCAIGSAPRDRHADALAMAKRGVELQPADGLAREALGAIYYRQAEYNRAIEHLVSATMMPESGTCPAYARYFLAMASHRLGMSAEAQNWLRKANDYTNQFSSAAPDVEPPLRWYRRATLTLLRTEAEQLLGSDGESADRGTSLDAISSPN